MSSCAPGATFAAMDFASRNLYRSAIEELARGSKRPELEIAQAAVRAARSHATPMVRATRAGRTSRRPGRAIRAFT